MNNKKKSCVRKFLGLMVRIILRIFPPLDILRINYFAWKRSNIILKFNPISFAEYCEVSGDRITIVEDAQARSVYQPEYFPQGDEKEYEFNSPAVYIAELKNVTVHGSSGLVFTEKKVLTDISANDTENRVQYRSGTIRRGNKKYFYVETSKDVDELDEAINLCGFAASNYYHLTLEILSRYEYVRRYVGDRNIPVLLDEDARRFPQYVELIGKVLADAKVIFVPEYKRIKCKNLIYPSMNTWMPMNVRKRNDFRIADNLIAHSAITNIQKAAKEYRLSQGDRKIFISRKNASFSRIVNESEVAQLFKDNGYDVVCTEALTYRQQVELFSSARCIVGATGAAFTNVIYCNPGTVFGCIIPRKYEFCIYSSIAHMVSCKELFLDAKVCRRDRAMSAEQYRVDMAECRQYINRLDWMLKH